MYKAAKQTIEDQRRQVCDFVFTPTIFLTIVVNTFLKYWNDINIYVKLINN